MKKNKPLQKFSNERLAQDRNLSQNQIADFLEEFRKIAEGHEGKRKLISLRVPEKLLEHFKKKSKLKGSAYQTQIVELMREWINK